TQDEEVGDGTTSVIVLAGELLASCEPFMANVKTMHPTQIVRALYTAMDVALRACEAQAKPFARDDREMLRRIIRSCVGTKFSGRWGDRIVDMAMDAV